MAATGEGEWLIKLERGWSTWMVGEQQFHGSTDESFRYNFGKTEFQVDFQSESEGTSTNLSTGKVRQICFVPRGQSPPSMEHEPESSVQPQEPRWQAWQAVDTGYAREPQERECRMG